MSFMLVLIIIYMLKVFIFWYSFIDKVVSHVSNNDIYQIMNDLIQIFAYDVKMFSILVSSDLFIECFLASSMDSKTGPTFISDWALDTTMNVLLSQYFTSQEQSTPIWTIHLCIGQLPENNHEIQSAITEKINIQPARKTSKKIKTEHRTIKIYYITFINMFLANMILDRDKGNTQTFLLWINSNRLWCC